jgi:hypothetical protein
MNAIKLLSERNITSLFLLNLSSHILTEALGLKAIFDIHLNFGKKGLTINKMA